MSTEIRTKKLRGDEAFVAEALCRAFKATLRVGEDPPDIYLLMEKEEVAVEISTLAQYIRDEHGETPRISQDTPPLRLADELNNEIGCHVPNDSHFFLILTSPLNALRKTKPVLSRKMLNMLAEPHAEKTERDEIIEGNKIGIMLFRDCEPTSRKVSAYVHNNRVGFDVLEEATDMLGRTISRKMKSSAKVLDTRTVWLALQSDYFFADFDGCKYAYEKLQPLHQFEKILLIERDGTVKVIYGRI